MAMVALPEVSVCPSRNPEPEAGISLIVSPETPEPEYSAETVNWPSEQLNDFVMATDFLELVRPDSSLIGAWPATVVYGCQSAPSPYHSGKDELNGWSLPVSAQPSPLESNML